jgi:hypothetical protein
MDSSDLAVQELLGFSCVRPLRTVAAFLEERGRLELLDDPLMEVRRGAMQSSGYLALLSMISAVYVALSAPWRCSRAVNHNVVRILCSTVVGTLDVDKQRKLSLHIRRPIGRPTHGGAAKL